MSDGYRNLVVLLLLVHGCSCGGTEPIGPVLLPDGTEPFDASIEYEGEGSVCSFSLDCEMRQICVDDVCVRHERIPVDELEFGEIRRMSRSEIESSRIYQNATIPWGAYRSDMSDAASLYEGSPLLGAWTVQGVDGPELIAIPMDFDHCQVLLIGSNVRVVAIDGQICTAATADDDGRIAIAGIRIADAVGVVTMLDRQGRILWQREIEASVHAELARPENWGVGGYAGHITSMLFYEGHLLASVRRGRATPLSGYRLHTLIGTTDQLGMAFLTIDTDDGTMSLLHRKNGSSVYEGRRGWLLDLGDHVSASMARASIDQPFGETFFVLNLNSEQETEIDAEFAWSGNYVEVAPGKYRFHFDRTGYASTITDETGRRLELFVVDSAAYAMGMDSRQGESDLDIPFVWSWAFTGVDEMPFVRIGPGAGDTDIVEIGRPPYAEPPIATQTFSPMSVRYTSAPSTLRRFNRTLEILTFSAGSDMFSIPGVLNWFEVALRRRAASDAGMP